MDFEFSEEQRLLKDSVERLLKDRYDFEQQLADCLLDLGALDLEDRGRRIRPVALAVALGGNDLVVNVLKGKKLTNIRAAGKDDNVLLTPPIRMTLE